ncbi:MAG: DUF445 domain-containing protein [Pseudomonadota bacterium]
MTDLFSDSARQEAQLVRMRRIATSLLAAMACMFATAQWLQPRFPLLSFVAAFAEAAMIGALADWFAVTALFRAPLGLPIPHTAIIPRNKDRIGNSVADFLENNFLTQEIISAELQPIDFSRVASRWLLIADNRRALVERCMHFLPSVIGMIDEKEVAVFLKSRSSQVLSEMELGPLVADIVGALVAQNRHHRLFDFMLSFGIETLGNNKPLIRQKIHERSPRWIPQSVDERFFIGLLEELEDFFEQMRLPDSQWRTKFQESIDEFMENLRHSPELQAKIAAIVSQGVDHPLFEEYGLQIWRDLKQKLLEDLQAENSSSARRLDQGLQAFATVINADAGVAIKLNTWLKEITTQFIVARRTLIANLVRRVIQSWDGETVSRKFELYIGRDLQYIRINGTIVGGIAGLALHLISVALH